jgi:hypothetical protein
MSRLLSACLLYSRYSRALGTCCNIGGPTPAHSLSHSVPLDFNHLLGKPYGGAMRLATEERY